MASDVCFHPTRRRVLTAASAALLFRPESGWAQEEPVVRLAMASLAPPFSWLETEVSGGESVRGIVPETLRVVFAAEGAYQVHFEAFPWSRAQRLVEEGVFDGFCTNATIERQRYALFGAEAVAVNEFAIFTTAAHPRLGEIRQIAIPADLRSFRQADFIGNGFAETLFAGLRDRILWQRELETVFRLIANGRADLAYVNEATGRHVLERMGLTARFAVIPIHLSPPSVYRLGLRRGFPDAKKLLARIDGVIRDLRARGTLDSIIARQA